MRSGSGVLCIAASQLLVGLVLLGLYEGYKSYYYSDFVGKEVKRGGAKSGRTNSYEDPLDPRCGRTQLTSWFMLGVVCIQPPHVHHRWMKLSTLRL